MLLGVGNDSVDGDEEALREFLADSGCLEPLRKWMGGFNAFDVLGITGSEIRHSNVLAWLMDPDGNHGLHDGVIRGFVDYAAKCVEDAGVFDDLLMDCDGFSIRREWRHIDILAVNDEAGYVLCIENKIFSGEHDDQLARYRDEIEREFPRYRHRFLFLTPGSWEASESDWISMGYGDVLDIIGHALDASTPPPAPAQFISEYMDTVRRNILEDRDLERVCARIYARHRRALDLIYEHRPDAISAISDCCREWIRRKSAGDKMIRFNEDTGDKWNTVFVTELLLRLFPGDDCPSGYWGEHCPCVYQIHVDNGKDGPKVRFQLVFNFDGLDGELRKRCGEVIRAISEVNGSSVKPVKIWRTIRITEYASVPVDSEEDWDRTLERTLNNGLGRLRDFEDGLSQNQRVRSLIAGASVR